MIQCFLILICSKVSILMSLQIDTVSAKPTISHDLRRGFGGAGFEGGQLGCGLELANHGRFDLHMLQNVQQGLSFAKAYNIVCVLCIVCVCVCVLMQKKHLFAKRNIF